MLRTVMVRHHCTALSAAVLLLGAAPLLSAGGQAQAPPPDPAVRFVVFRGGRQIGAEQSSLTKTAQGWVLRGSGRIGQPVDLSTGRFEARYDSVWRPLSVEIDATEKGTPSVTRTTFADGSATSEVSRAGEASRKVDAVSADPVLIPPRAFFSAFEALTMRLRTMTLPAALRGYVVGQGEIPIAVTSAGSERIQTPAGSIAVKRYACTIEETAGPLQTEIWATEEGRLLRFRIPADALEVAREDVSTVTARVEQLGRPNDEQVRMPAYGFNLAGTLSKPASSPAAPGPKGPRPPALPAVILVSGGGYVDRDENVAGVAVFAHAANALADAGFAVVRYDKRGVGQSGGRSESATAADYAEDARAVVRFLRKRRDIDAKRIALVGYGEGGPVAMLAAAGSKDDVAALALVAAPGTTGSDYVIEQQQQLMNKMGLSDADRQGRIELQEKIHHAVLTGAGWESIPDGYRAQADTAWFRSLLLFDPARVMEKVRQPVLVLQAGLDRQVAARHGALLLEAAKARKKAAPADLVTVDGVNHLLAPAETGEISEYAALPDKRVSPKVLEALVPWLKDKMYVGVAGKAR